MAALTGKRSAVFTVFYYSRWFVLHNKRAKRYHQRGDVFEVYNVLSYTRRPSTKYPPVPGGHPHSCHNRFRFRPRPSAIFYVVCRSSTALEPWTMRTFLNKDPVMWSDHILGWYPSLCRKDLWKLFPRKNSAQLQKFVCTFQWISRAIPPFLSLRKPLLAIMKSIYERAGKCTNLAVRCVLLSDVGWSYVHTTSFQASKNAMMHQVALFHYRAQHRF